MSNSEKTKTIKHHTVLQRIQYPNRPDSRTIGLVKSSCSKDADVIVGILQSPFWQDTKKSGHFSAFLMLVLKTVLRLL